MKDAVISIRLDEKIKNKLIKIAEDNRREFSDFLRLLLTDVADKKIKVKL